MTLSRTFGFSRCPEVNGPTVGNWLQLSDVCEQRWRSSPKVVLQNGNIFSVSSIRSIWNDDIQNWLWRCRARIPVQVCEHLKGSLRIILWRETASNFPAIPSGNAETRANNQGFRGVSFVISRFHEVTNCQHSLLSNRQKFNFLLLNLWFACEWMFTWNGSNVRIRNNRIVTKHYSFFN